MTPTTLQVTDLSTYAGTWALDPARTSVEFLTKAMWVLKVRGTMQVAEGSATVAPDGALTGSLVLDTATIDTKNKKRDTHLQTADFFEVQKYPTITFTATSGTPLPSGQMELVGELVIHGRSRPITVLADVTGTDTEATFTATFDVDRSAWGLTWTKMGAAVANQVTVTATFVKN